ncbi:hypothetical protein CI102_9718 [Trichoderma harzianum]|nr:hypothetical protein CI102_9718 [Trichoderma harzianum]
MRNRKWLRHSGLSLLLARKTASAIASRSVSISDTCLLDIVKISLDFNDGRSGMMKAKSNSGCKLIRRGGA